MYALVSVVNTIPIVVKKQSLSFDVTVVREYSNETRATWTLGG
jgi:hypothetical protein